MTFFSLKNYANVLSKSNKQENLRQKQFLLTSLRRKEQDPDSYVSGTDPHQIVTDPQLCLGGFNSIVELIPRRNRFLRSRWAFEDK